jgi:flagellar protein FlaJ
MVYWNKRERTYVYVATGASAAMILIVAILVWTQNNSFANYLIAIAGITVLVPLSVIWELENRWKVSIEDRIPDLLEDIGEGQLAGMTFVKALEQSASKNFGALSEELRRVINNIRVGGTVEEAFTVLAERVNSKIVRMATTIIIETNRSGGDIDRIVRTMANYFWEVKASNTERRGSMRIYVAITYISFVILLVTIMIIMNQLLYPLIAGGGTPIFTSEASYEQYRLVLFHMSLLLAVFTGLTAGKMGEGKIRAGLKHTIIMMVMATVVFAFLIIPGTV